MTQTEKDNLEKYGMDTNEYLLRKNYVEAINARDELRNQVKALTAINKGLTTSLQEALQEMERLKSNF